jgi:hypothetical protein
MYDRSDLYLIKQDAEESEGMSYREQYIEILKRDSAYNSEQMALLDPSSEEWKAYSRENAANQEEIKIMQALIAREKKGR